MFYCKKQAFTVLIDFAILETLSKSSALFKVCDALKNSISARKSTIFGLKFEFVSPPHVNVKLTIDGSPLRQFPFNTG